MNEHLHQPNAALLAEIEVTCSCSNVRKAARAVTQLFDELLQPTGLTATQFTRLVAVALLGEAPVTDFFVVIRVYTRNQEKPMLKEQTLSYTEHVVQRGPYHLSVREYPGEEPAIVLMHGFPDTLHLYDRLLPWLSPPRRVVTFDFLGWGASEKPAGYPYTAANQTLDLDAVIEQLKLEHVVLVAHDASGPPAIDWALAHADRVAALVLLNTYYCVMPTLRPPEAILLFSTPLVRNVARRLESLSQLALPQDVLVAGWQIHARGSRQGGVPALALSAICGHTQCPTRFLSPE